MSLLGVVRSDQRSESMSREIGGVSHAAQLSSCAESFPLPRCSKRDVVHEAVSGTVAEVPPRPRPKPLPAVWAAGYLPDGQPLVCDPCQSCLAEPVPKAIDQTRADEIRLIDVSTAASASRLFLAGAAWPTTPKQVTANSHFDTSGNSRTRSDMGHSSGSPPFLSFSPPHGASHPLHSRLPSGQGQKSKCPQWAQRGK